MKLVKSKEVLDFLSKSAPRAWIERMLMGMICSAELRPYFTSGKVLCSVYKRGELLAVAERAGIENTSVLMENLEQYFDLNVAEKIREGSLDDFLEVVEFEFSGKDDGARHVPSLLFFYADEIDWKDGDLYVELDYEIVSGNGLVFDDEFFWV